MSRIKPDKVMYTSNTVHMYEPSISPVFMNQYTGIPISGDIVKAILQENKKDIHEIKK